MINLTDAPRVDELEVAGKCVFVRVDLDVPFDADGTQIIDDARLRAVLPTVQSLSSRGARVVLASHRSGEGAPTLEPCAERLAELLNTEIYFPDDCVGDARKLVVGNLRAGQICLLENLAQHPEEAEGDLAFAQRLADGAHIYVNDAFPSAFSTSASLLPMPRLFKDRAVGLRIREEVAVFNRLAAESIAVVLTAGSAREAQPWIRALGKRVSTLYVPGELGRALQRASRLTGAAASTSDYAEVKALFALADAASSMLVFPKGDVGELDAESIAALRTAPLLLWIDATEGQQPRDTTAGFLEFAEGIAGCPGFKAVVGDALVAALARKCPENLGKMNFASTASAAALKLLEGRRSAALEAFVGAG